MLKEDRGVDSAGRPGWAAVTVQPGALQVRGPGQFISLAAARSSALRRSVQLQVIALAVLERRDTAPLMIADRAGELHSRGC